MTVETITIQITARSGSYPDRLPTLAEVMRPIADHFDEQMRRVDEVREMTPESVEALMRQAMKIAEPVDSTPESQ